MPSAGHLNLKALRWLKETPTTYGGFAFAAHNFFQNKLIDMYVKCRSLINARKVFDEMTERDGFSWNVIIAAYRKCEYPHEALTLFHLMQHTGVQPDEFTLASILPACAKVRALEQGMDIHQRIIQRGFLSNVIVASALIDMYVKCGSLQMARKLFDNTPQRNVVSWNGMIAGYAQNGILDKALRLFEDMPSRDVVSWNTMITGYAQNGALDEALRLFQNMPQRNVISWNAMIAGYAQNGVLDEALRLFKEMPERDVVSWTAMIAGYAQNGNLGEASRVFKEMPQKNVVSWNAIIAGYTQNGLVEKALETFKQMQSAGVQPNSKTFASILPACAEMGALEHGMDIHQNILETGIFSNVVVVSALVDMYAKCGSLQKARELFDKISQRDSILWSAMIAGYAMHGFYKDAFELFTIMKLSGIYPDHVSFGCVLLACSHAGLVNEGCKYFNSICDSYCIIPSMDHYVCMVDLLGRAGYLEEALNFIIKMPIEPAVVVWTCLLGSCRLHKTIGLGEFTATLLFGLDPKNSTPYILLSNIYAELGRCSDVQRIRKLMENRGIKKVPGCSWIEVQKVVHVFSVFNTSYPPT
ncbi:pentatricopeptide repeat-containing protein At2g13600 [Cryptomeria japonica]|uniref:pentatricopeptide repeat-containing protein At2g13600 n=1 Tax=Cryptomeria japonica TaxID=3369 RepID=UPI0027DA9C4A|nr:pentatricopeptide repeat-containing protein At2g13600 [Cryptomeria japonica]